jgi:hypothetical protein
MLFLANITNDLPGFRQDLPLFEASGPSTSEPVEKQPGIL